MGIFPSEGYARFNAYHGHLFHGLDMAFGLITDEDVLANDGFNLGFTYLNSGDTDIKGYKINFGYHF